MKYVFRKKSLAALAAAADAAGSPFYRRRKLSLSGLRTLLFVRLDHLGDILPATGIPQILREHFPGSRVLFLTSPAGAKLLENNPYVDETLVYDAPWFRRGAKRAEGSASWLSLVRRLRERRIDLALAPRGDARENALLFLTGAKNKIGYGITGGGFLLDRELTYRRGAHETQHSLDLLRALGIQRETLLPSIHFSESEERQAKALADGTAGGVTIGVQWEAGSEAKTWPQANRDAFLERARLELPDARFLFVGGDARAGKALDARLAAFGAGRALNLIGKTDLRELMLRLKTCRLFVGPDSGPAHLAAALGVPTLFLYSGTNRFEEWASAAENADFLRHAVPCSPCHLTECPVEGHPCMSGIQPEAVVRWLRERFRG